MLLSFKIMAVVAAITPSAARPCVHSQTAVPITPTNKTAESKLMLTSKRVPNRICA